MTQNPKTRADFLAAMLMKKLDEATVQNYVQKAWKPIVVNRC